MFTYSTMKKYCKAENGKYINYYVSKDPEEINKELLESLYWKYIVNAGCIKRIVKTSYSITVYHDNGHKVVFSK